MRQNVTKLGVGTLAILLVLTTVVRADEESVPLDKVPQAVMDAVKARFKDADVKSAGQEKEDDKLVYEITLKLKGQNIDVTLTPEGQILLIEKTIAAKDLPQATAEALKTKFPGAAYKIVEEITKVDKKTEKLAYYEVLLVTAEKKTLEVQVTSLGKIANEEQKDPEKDE